MTEAHLISYQLGADERILNGEGSVSRQDSYFRSAAPPIADAKLSRNDRCSVPIPESCTAANGAPIAGLLDELVSSYKEGLGHN